MKKGSSCAFGTCKRCALGKKEKDMEREREISGISPLGQRLDRELTLWPLLLFYVSLANYCNTILMFPGSTLNSVQFILKNRGRMTFF